MSKYFLQVLTENNGEDVEVGDTIPLEHYLAATKPISNLLTEINDRIDEFEEEDIEDEDDEDLLDDE
jgi:hypothetical protein